MLKETIFRFHKKICKCPELNYNYGLAVLEGEPVFVFQCIICSERKTISIGNLNPSFVVFKEEVESDLKNVIEDGNILYGPWNGSDRPEIK